MGVLLMKDGHFKDWSDINKMMVIAALLMLIFGSLDVAFGLRQNLDAFVYQFAKGVDPADEFGRISKWINVMKFANYSVQTFIGDGILVSCYHPLVLPCDIQASSYPFLSPGERVRVLEIAEDMVAAPACLIVAACRACL